LRTTVKGVTRLHKGSKHGRDEGVGLVAERLAGAAIESTGDGIQLRLADARKVGAFGKVLAQQAVGVLVGPALPRAVWIDPSLTL